MPVGRILSPFGSDFLIFILFFIFLQFIIIMTLGPAVLEINKLKPGNCSILSTAVVEVCWRAEGRVGFGQDFIAVFQLCLR